MACPPETRTEPLLETDLTTSQRGPLLPARGSGARLSVHEETSVAAVDRVGRTVAVRRAGTARAGPEAGRGPAAGTGPAGVLRDPVRPAHRHPMGVPAPGVGLRIRHDLLAASGRLERGRRVGPTPRVTAEGTAVEEPTGLVTGGDRISSHVRAARRGPKADPARSTAHAAASTTSSPTGRASRSRCH